MLKLKVCRLVEDGVGLLWTLKSFDISVEAVGGKLRGVEFFCRDEVLVRWHKYWEEGGRKFKLEREGHLGGWVVLVEKLRSLGVIPSSEVKELGSSVEVKTIPKERIAVESLVEAVRKDLRVVEDVKLCDEALVIERRGEDFSFWGSIALFDFNESFEVDRVLVRGDFCCTFGVERCLKIWRPLWGFVVVDEDTALLSHLQWARILVKYDGRIMPGSLQVDVGSFSFVI
ncbi:hypothetical protein CK203_064914 [Vitis vinifera]|uniref:DUF4283 domain-containing protein n=1 Tax=Vitis vinifera TaxID=29760 RepID=A0A438FPP6_VITVI|nr:hypothetical protein CK203_064914 [Vitis vinifera]